MGATRNGNGAVLVACEESQAVTTAMRALGIPAFSCDLGPATGGHPEWHIQGDVIPLLKEPWAMILAFPPCTHLAVSGARYFMEKRLDGRQQEGIAFFLQFTTTICERVAIENPIGIMSRLYRKPDQIIHPWQFGEDASKATCLWLKGLPPPLSRPTFSPGEEAPGEQTRPAAVRIGSDHPRPGRRKGVKPTLG